MSKKIIMRLTVHGMLLQFTYWFAICTYIAFMVVTLMDFGWSTGAAAGAMTAMSVMQLFAQPFSGFLSDKFFSEKQLIILAGILSATFLALLPITLNSENSIFILANMAGITLTAMPIAGLIDSWIIGLSQEFSGINYGITRGVGSIGWAIAAQFVGVITHSFGHSARLVLGSGFFILLTILATCYRTTKRQVANKNEEITDKVPELTGKDAFKLMFSSKQYCLLLAVSFFLMLSIAAIGMLLQILILVLDGTAAHIGTANAIMAGSELPLMFFTAFLLTKFSFKKMFVFSSIFFLLRVILMAIAGNLGMLLAVQALQGLSFAILLPVSMNYLTSVVDIRVRSTSIATFGAVTGSLTAIIGNLITTTKLELGFSVQNILLVFAAITSIGCILAIYGVVKKIWDINSVIVED